MCGNDSRCFGFEADEEFRTGLSTVVGHGKPPGCSVSQACVEWLASEAIGTFPFEAGNM
jgi:hypothetical protein